jgi:hypothetical protein
LRLPLPHQHAHKEGLDGSVQTIHIQAPASAAAALPLPLPLLGRALGHGGSQVAEFALGEKAAGHALLGGGGAQGFVDLFL